MFQSLVFPNFNIQAAKKETAACLNSAFLTDFIGSHLYLLLLLTPKRCPLYAKNLI
jgi:hypothetical protein